MSFELVYGVHAVKSKLKVHPDSIEVLYCLKSKERIAKMQELIKLAEQKKVVCEFVGKTKFASLMQEYEISEQVVHQDVFAKCVSNIRIHDESDLSSLLQRGRKTPLILVLDGLQDPHNLGACIRTADAVGVDFVVFPKDRSANVNATVQKVASGAIESVTLVAVTNISRTLKFLQSEGVWIVGMAGEAKEYLYDLDLNISTAIVMGAEGTGLRHGTKKVCDYLAKLPMNGRVSSLNVSVATGVALYEAVRQRDFV